MHVTLEITRTICHDVLLNTVKSRGVKFFCFTNNEYEFRDLQPVEPDLSLSMVHTNDQEKLEWPVTLLLPEYKIVDCVENFCEDEM